MAFELFIRFSPQAETDQALLKTQVLSWLDSIGRSDYVEGVIDGVETQLTSEELLRAETDDERLAISPIAIYESTEARAKALWSELLLEFGKGIQVQLNEIHDESWMNCWREEFSSFATKNFLIAPLGDPTATPVGLTRVEIDASGNAFGTGQHATTRAIIQVMEERFPVWKPQSLLDVGTGTGIYLILAYFLGVKELAGTEISEELVELARANCELANVPSQIEFVDVPSFPRKFDVIIANILVPVLHDLMEKMSSLLVNHGRLIVAGFVEKEQQPLVEKAAKFGLKLEVQGEELGWKFLVFTRA